MKKIEFEKLLKQESAKNIISKYIANKIFLTKQQLNVVVKMGKLEN